MTFDLTMWLLLALLASITVNIFGVWYIRRVLSKLIFVGENLSDLVELVISYRNHLSGVYELEQYYGDQDISNLVEHTNKVIEILEQDYSDIYTMTTIPEREEENIEEETEINAETEIKEQDVFYAGTRKRNT